MARIKAAEDANLELAMKTAREKGWPTNMFLAGGRQSRLAGIRKDGSPIYKGEFNALSAVSGNVYPLRTSTCVPEGLRGEGFKVGVWDVGRAALDHPLFGGRVRSGDGNTGEPSVHATHVTGTIAGDYQGPEIGPKEAVGMAPAVQVDDYTSANDLSEMVGAAAVDGQPGTNIFISNHSYGLRIGWDYSKGYKADNTNSEPVWLGFPGDSRDRVAGMYDTEARSLDELTYEASYYLPFFAAGNDRGGALAATATFFWRYDNSFRWVKITNLVNAPGPNGGRPGGYETIPTSQNAKNIMTVGSVADAVNTYLEMGGGVQLIKNEQLFALGLTNRAVSKAKVSAFSAWGPTDDGRIKPDLMANGEGLLSASVLTNGITILTNALYPNGFPVMQRLTGTSMASPSAAGASILLQQYHHHLFGSAMHASLLKALLLHTADDLEAVGPDYRTGWGLINAEEAAKVLQRAHQNPKNANLYESYLEDVDPNAPASGGSRTAVSFSFPWTGFETNIKATLVWTDPPGASTTNEVRTPRLVNDLDLRLISPSGIIHFPWVLDPANPQNPASRGDNVLDNVEQIVVAAPEPGNYTLLITRKNQIQSYAANSGGTAKQLRPYGRQSFSLVLSGNGPQIRFEEGLDQPALVWDSGGTAPWMMATDAAVDGVDYARAVLTDSPQATYFETTVEGGQRVSWWWRMTGPEPRSPILFVTVNGREVARLDRPTPWQPAFQDLGPGRYTIRWNYVAEMGVNARAFSAGVDLVRIGVPESQTYFGVTPAKATDLIQAEDFDVGEPGDAYVDSDLINDGNAYRTSGVDITPTSDTGGGFAIFNTKDGEWLEYTTLFPFAGLYSLELRVAAAQTGSILRVAGLDIEIPATGGADQWQTITRSGFQLLNGTAPVRVTWVKGGARLNWMRWTLLPWPTRRAFASAANPGALPWNIATTRIQAEDFDTAGESIAYHDTDGTNSGRQYRTNDAVDIKITDDPLNTNDFHVTQFVVNEWMRYSVKVPTTDDYEVRVRLRPVSPQGFTFASGQVLVSLGGGGDVPLGFNASTAQWLTLTGRVSLVAQSVNSDLTLKCTIGAADVNWIEFSRVPATGLTKLMYLDQPGLLLDSFYPQPRGQGQYPRGQERFSHPRIPSSLESELLREAFEVYPDVGENYGVVVAGYVAPPVTSDYTFYLCSNDQGELWLSTDENPQNSRLIATEPEGNTSRAWTTTLRRPLVNGRPSNVSEPIHLEAGRRYYVEAAMKQGTGGDNLAVAWRRPGEAAIVDLASPIESQHLRPLDVLPMYEVQSTMASPAAIQYGTPLGSNQLNVVLGKHGDAGAIQHDPPAGTILPAGTHTLQAVWIPRPEFELEFARVTNSTTLVVTRAPLVITANSAQREKGQPNPAFTATYSGLVNGDTAGHLERGVQFRCAAAPSSAPGEYRITPDGASDPDYTITYQTAWLTVVPAAQRPFADATVSNPSATPVPGRIEAEAFDQGGEGRAYHDVDAANIGGQLRPAEGVDIEVTTDTGGGHDITSTAAGEWLEYGIDVAESGDYNLTLRVAQAGSASIVRLWVGGQPVTTPIALPDTGGVQNWTSVTKWSIPLSAGGHTMRVEWIEGGANLNWIEWQPVADDAPRPLVQWLFDGNYTDSLLGRNLIGAFLGGAENMPDFVNDSPSGDANDLSVRFTGATFAHLPAVEETQPVNLEGRSYTAEAWIKLVRPASFRSTLVSWGHPGAGGWSTWIDSEGNLGATTFGIADLNSTANVPNDGQWHNVAFAHQLGQQFHFFVDGQLKQTLAETRGVLPTADHTLHLGYEWVDGSPLNPFVGQMDRLRISSGALPASQLDYPAVPTGEENRGLNRLVYRYIPGVTLDDFYPTRGHGFLPRGSEPTGPAPTRSGSVDNFEAPADVDENYGQVLFGYIRPTQTDDYTFYFCSDDQGELWLSTDANSVNARLIASEPEGNGGRNWTGVDRRPLTDGRRSNVSKSIRLEAGKYYYVEAAMKEGTGGDNLGVAWQRAGTPAPANGSAPIGGQHLRTVLLQAAASPGVSSIDLIVNGSFEKPRLNNVNENNLGTIPIGWSQTGLDETWNLIQNDGTPYASGVNTAKEGSQILDLAGPFEIFQDFTLSEASTVSFGASFANRESHDESAPSTVGIYNGAGNTLLSSLVIVDTSADPTPSVGWRSGAATVDLPAGQYQIRIALNDFNNVDAVFARTPRSSNADLAGLVPSTGALSPAFALGTLAYTVSVPNSTSSLTLTPTAAQADATIRVNGTVFPSGAASGAIALNVGSNSITVTVTAQDDTTVKSYVVTVTRAASASSRDLIVNGSFEQPRLSNVNENNLGTIPTGWSQTGLDETWNLVQNDGTPYASGVSTAKDGSQILDLAGPLEIFQDFTLSEAWTVSFGASFANRESHDGSAASTVGIYNGAGNTLLSSLVIVDTSADPTPSVEWRSGAATVDLPAGQYQIRIALNDFNNVDAVFARTSSLAAADPRLTINQAGASRVVSWETAAGFILERTDRLTPGAAWTNVPFTTTVNTSSAIVTPGATSSSFFRLRRQ